MQVAQTTPRKYSKRLLISTADTYFQNQLYSKWVNLPRFNRQMNSSELLDESSRTNRETSLNGSSILFDLIIAYAETQLCLLVQGKHQH